ncbi:MAG: ATP synthase F1 subunit delta [Bacteroidales bacterium]|nr:ATP synthase F1 subunit delta [Bacteroidales bacterium]
MDQGLLPRRYAKALYKFAVDENCTKDIYLFMQNIDNAYMHAPGLQTTLANPFVKPAEKMTLVVSAAGDAAASSKPLADFVTLLIKNRRIGLLHEIALSYCRLYRKENNIYGVQIVSAMPLTEPDEQRLRNLVERHLGGASAEFSFAVDPSLVGGFVVNIENERLDASVKNELEQLRLNLIK